MSRSGWAKWPQCLFSGEQSHQVIENTKAVPGNGQSKTDKTNKANFRIGRLALAEWASAAREGRWVIGPGGALGGTA